MNAERYHDNMLQDVFLLNDERTILESGTNVYPRPEYHPDRVMNVHDLLYVVEGEMRVAQDEENYTLHSGDLLILYAGCHHWGTSRCSVNCRTLFIHFNCLPSDRHQAVFSEPEVEASSSGKNILLPSQIHCGIAERIEELFHQINHVFWSRRSDKSRVLSLMINLLLCELGHVARKQQPHSDPWTVELLRYLNNDLTRNVSLEEISERTGMSVRTVSERFRTVTGQSIHQYQLNLRLDAAYSCLRSERRSVKEVASMFGFCDPYYFSRMFKQKFGQSPSEIRNRDPGANLHRSPVD